MSKDIGMTSAAAPLDVADAKKVTYWRYGMLALITLVLTLSAGDRAALSVAGSTMTQELNISAVELGYLFSAFSWAYVIFQMPAGWLADKIGSKLAMGLAVATWSLVTILMGFAHYFPMVVLALLVMRFLLGVCESPVGPAGGRVIASWFPSSERGTAGAIFNSAQYLSLAIFTPFMGWLCHQYGWDSVFIVMGLIGLVVAVIWAKFYYLPVRHPKLPVEELEYIRAGEGLVDLETLGSKGQGQKKTSQWADIRQLFRNRMMVGIFLAQYCINAITWFYMSWFPIYLVKDRGLDILQAGFIAAIPALCGLIGGVSSGFVSDALLKKTGSLSIARKTPITIGLLLSASIMLCTLIDSAWLVVVVMSLAFFGKGFGSLGWAVVADTAPKRLIGTTGGVFGAIGNLSGIVTPVVIGYLLQSSGSFASALIYVGVHGLVAVFSYWVIVGKIQRMALD
ncbi:MFS transporter [Pantoea sp. Ap-967]|uniref:MFS transporter n=1 Tax=Pantoea sp. Ap-967 TaxID=2608362 RepID=UPI0014217013|nr:MFS transporter [Pantoea sp. Ap-967]NIE73296.1 MFS transporter [Pantoea sp. Ap-967]